LHALDDDGGDGGVVACEKFLEGEAEDGTGGGGLRWAHWAAAKRTHCACGDHWRRREGW
jgi:hypothetical protein